MSITERREDDETYMLTVAPGERDVTVEGIYDIYRDGGDMREASASPQPLAIRVRKARMRFARRTAKDRALGFHGSIVRTDRDTDSGARGE